MQPFYISSTQRAVIRFPDCNLALARTGKEAAAAALNEVELLKPEIAERVAAFLRSNYPPQLEQVLQEPSFYAPFAAPPIVPLLQGYLGSIANIVAASDHDFHRIG